jgi:tRNA nucleotidyltransferase (CCA-adding enzyme)
MELAADLTVDDTELRAFCREHGIRSLRLFGSAARDELRDDSDIDLLVEFERAGPPVCSESPSSNSSSRSCSAERSTSEPSGI